MLARTGVLRLALGTPAALVLAAASTAPAQVFRSFDGTGNNLANPSWGAAGTPLLRLTNGYADGIHALAGADRPNPRAISNAIVSQHSSIPNSRNLSDWVWQWGQFLDHDFDSVSPASPAQPAFIPVPAGDPVFGFASIPFHRSNAAPGAPYTQINDLTAFLDASMVYGSDAATANALRAFSGGRLATSPHATGDLLPADASGNFRAGDGRVNEQLGLTAVHTLFVREHNRWADTLASANPALDDEAIYQRARAIVAAEVQAITFNEWLPALTGAPVPAYGGYDPTINPGVTNEFAAALFRVGHTMLSPTLRRLDNSLASIPAGDIALRDAFFQPGRIRAEGGIDPLVLGLAHQRMQEIDQHIVEDVRSFLFTIPTGGFDLAALNIQRARDHGLGTYNDVREALGLPRLADFAQITSNPALASQLQALYGSIDLIDPWIGALAEDHLPGSSIGELLTAGILDQFLRARAGDRFWYQNDPLFQTDPLLAPLFGQIHATTLADVIRRNTGALVVQDNVFFVPAPSAMVLLILGAAALAPTRRRTT